MAGLEGPGVNWMREKVTMRRPKHSVRLQRWLLPVGTLALSTSLAAAPLPARVKDQQPAPDNTKTNKDQGSPTADQQKMNPADRAISQKIRQAIQADNSLSTYAHNIKIITRDGKVTLRGPVKSEDEKTRLGEKAVEVAGADNVTNNLRVAPAK
jgi:hyperosmotically inducible periplasmic protein